MLQWMGGSRRKVTTSRRSTQKRQKQYFEQRRRKQHQQAAGLDSYEEGVNIRGDNYRENRSLDVLSLQNWPRITKDCTPTNHLGSPSEFHGREDPKINTSTVNSHIFMDPPKIRANPASPPQSLEVKEKRTQPGYKPETVSPKKVLFSSSNNRRKAFSRTDNKLDPCKTTTQQASSVFDLVADDGPNGNSDGSPPHEAHVGFSVEGLGKMGAETSPFSPQQPDRYGSYDCPSPLKATRKIISSKNIDYVLDDLEVEVDAIMQNADTPPRGHPLEFLMEIEDSYCKLKDDLSTVTDRAQFDGHSRMRSSYGGRETFCETKNNNDNIWDAGLRSWDASFIDEKESALSWNSWPYPMDGNSADFLKYRTDRLPDYAFEGSDLLKKRDSMNAKEAFNILDSPSLKHQAPESDFDFMISERARQPSLGTDFGFGDTTIRPDWSCFTAEEARDNQSLLSEESSSSTAVRGKGRDISPSNSRARCSQRHQNASGFPENNCSAENIFLKGRQLKNGEEIQKGNNVFGSGKSTRISVPLDSRSAHNLDCPFREKIGSRTGSLFEEGYGSADMNMGFSSPCQASETKHLLSGSKPWTEDTFGAFFPEQQIDAKFSSDTSKHDGSVKHSPSGSFFSEKFAFCQQSSCMHVHDPPTFSKIEFGATKPDFSLDSPDFGFKVNPPESSDDAASHGEKLVLELSAKESVSKVKKNRSNFQQTNYKKVETWNSPVEKNMKLMDALESEDNGTDCSGAKGPLETSSSAKIANKSESSVDKKEYHHDAEVSPPCENGNKEIENEVPGDRKTSRDGNHLDSSPPVMMLKSYVLQLLCVQKATKVASLQTP